MIERFCKEITVDGQLVFLYQITLNFVIENILSKLYQQFKPSDIRLPKTVGSCFMALSLTFLEGLLEKSTLFQFVWRKYG